MGGKGKTLLLGSGSGSGPMRRREEERTSRSSKAGLKFPVGRIERSLKIGKFADRIGSGAPIYLAAVLEYLASEVLELAGWEAKDGNKQRITPRHIQLAVSRDKDLKDLFGEAIIPSGGVLPCISNSLGPKNSNLD